MEIYYALLGGFGFGSIVSTAVAHFLEKEKLKKERAFTLQKEIYFNLQQKAEDVLRGIYYYDTLFAEQDLNLIRYQDYDYLLHLKFDNESQGRQEKLGSTIFIYFPSLVNDYALYTVAIRDYSNKAGDVSKARQMQPKDLQDFKDLRKGYNKERDNLLGKINDFLDEIRKSLN